MKRCFPVVPLAAVVLLVCGYVSAQPAVQPQPGAATAPSATPPSNGWLPELPAAPPPPPGYQPPDQPVLPAPVAPAAPQDPAVASVIVDYLPSSEATLERHIIQDNQTRWQIVCQQACRATLDPRFVYRVAGDSVVESGKFMLPSGQARATLRADVGSRSTLIGGFVGAYVGGTAVAVGLMTAAFGALLEDSPGPAYDTAGARDVKNTGIVIAAVGAAVGITGLVFAVSNLNTKVTIDGAHRAGATARARLKLSPGVWLTGAGLEF